MILEAEYQKAEEHEPVNPYLRVGMSPHPTRSKRMYMAKNPEM
jgi:hypothetical protein